MKKFVIAGTGAVASELTMYINNHNSLSDKNDRIEIKGYIDWKMNAEKNFSKYKFNAPLIADFNSFEQNSDEEVLLGFANIGFKKQIVSEFKSRNIIFGSFVHHSVIIPTGTFLGEGNIIYPFCIIGANVTIGSWNLITSFSFVSHDCKIGNYNFFSTSGIAGGVSIGDSNFFGIRTTVIPNISIGNNNTIQAGMILDKNIGHDETVFFRFKEKVIAIPGNNP